MNIRVADYITDCIYKNGGETVFLVTGGMIMHLTDALYQHEKQQYVSCHHEQAAAMAAEAYGRMTNKLGAVYVTAGPGALNAITGVAGAYIDSSPSIIVAGNSKVSLAKVKGPRQFPLQGFDSLPIFSQITKYAVMLDDISRVRYEVEKCLYIAKSGRVGPVYLEVPVDLQGAYFDPEIYEGYVPDTINYEITEDEITEVMDSIAQSKRPCLLVGAGVRAADALDSFLQFAEKFNVPILTSRLGMDLISHDHPLFVGRPGTYGDRPANFTIQNCDLLLTVGCRLGIGLVGYDFHTFASKAKKIYIDIDSAEINKPSVNHDIRIQADALDFFRKCNEFKELNIKSNDEWIQQTQSWKRKYPVDLSEYDDDSHGINSYRFMTLFSQQAPEDATVVVDTGSCFHVHAQAFKVKSGQRHIITGGLSTMGYTPAAIGVSIASNKKEVFCITGDGSFQMNLQELQTIKHNQLPIKFVLLNNDGYLLIRHTQNNFMEGRYIGEGPNSGVSFADFSKVAETFGLGYMKIDSLSDIEDKIVFLLNYNGPIICEVKTPSDQLLIPRVSSKKLDDGTMMSMPYDDMFPFLPRDEYLNNCLD
jgi:acetolactate synthase I/II/III large subunit